MDFNLWLMTCWKCLVAGREAAVWHLVLPGEFRWESDKVVYSRSPSTLEAEAGGLRFQDQPELQIRTEAKPDLNSLFLGAWALNMKGDLLISPCPCRRTGSPFQ